MIRVVPFFSSENPRWQANGPSVARSVVHVNTTRHHLPSASRLLTALAMAFVLLASGAKAATRWATLEAIHRLENPRDLTQPGPCGELGAYQFRENTWRMHTSVPFACALERRASDEVAIKHYEWLKQGLERAGLPATTYTIALAWNGGLNAAVRGRAQARARDYAERAANLANAFGAETVASAR